MTAHARHRKADRWVSVLAAVDGIGFDLKDPFCLAVHIGGRADRNVASVPRRCFGDCSLARHGARNAYLFSRFWKIVMALGVSAPYRYVNSAGLEDRCGRVGLRSRVVGSCGRKRPKGMLPG